MSILQELARVFRHAVPVKKFVEKAASLVQTFPRFCRIFSSTPDKHL